jgi:hypothetical protein
MVHHWVLTLLQGLCDTCDSSEAVTGIVHHLKALGGGDNAKGATVDGSEETLSVKEAVIGVGGGCQQLKGSC